MLVRAGWDIQAQVREEVSFTNGRIIVRGRLHTRGKRRRADCLLSYHKNHPIAVIEAKDNRQGLGDAMQQALAYSDALDVPFVFASNGDGFLLHDRTGLGDQTETVLGLNDFPSPEMLWERYCRYKGLGPTERPVVEQPNYDDGSGRSPRYYQRIAINPVEAVARGQDRILLVMATGSGVNVSEGCPDFINSDCPVFISLNSSVQGQGRVRSRPPSSSVWSPIRLDASSERIITYLNQHAQLSINALFFAAFEDGGNPYLSRAWMIDPDEPGQPVARKARKEPWNGEFYASFGSDYPGKDARRLGFLCGGGAAWYSKTLAMLSEGDRVWVYIPKTGYVGVGEVVGERCRADEYRFDTPEGPRTLQEMELTEGYPQINPTKDDDEAEYLVPVRWIHTVRREEAFNEVGLFGNQNTVCKPTTPKWSHTVNRLKQAWGIES